MLIRLVGISAEGDSLGGGVRVDATARDRMIRASPDGAAKDPCHAPSNR